MDLGILTVLGHLETQVSTRALIAWIVHNIACSSDEHLQAIFDSGLLPGIVDMLQSNDHGLQAQGMRTVSQVLNRSTSAQIVLLLHTDVVSTLREMLSDGKNASFARSSVNVLLSKVKVHDPPLYQQLLLQLPPSTGW